MPPDALTPARRPATDRMRAMSSIVAPPVEKPVEVLIKSAPAARAISHGAEFLFKAEQAGFEDDFDDGAGPVGKLDDAANIMTDRVVVFLEAGLQEPDVEHHVDVVRAELENACGLIAL